MRCPSLRHSGGGRRICQLFWKVGEKVSGTIEIRSGESAHLMLFVRKEDGSNTYFAYQPTSQSNLAPTILNVPRFNGTMKFQVQISYSHANQSLQFPVEVYMGYDGSFSLQ